MAVALASCDDRLRESLEAECGGGINTRSIPLLLEAKDSGFTEYEGAIADSA
jgi:hypothetical protein